jgi:hypothetical protein
VSAGAIYVAATSPASAAALTSTADTPGSLGNGGRYDRGLASDALWCLLHPESILGASPSPLDPETVLP